MQAKPAAPVRMRRALAILAAALVAGCASTAEERRQLATTPGLQGFAAVYSEFDMRLQLVTAADAPACAEAACQADRSFDQRILAIGGRLANVAYRTHADLHLRFPRFEFVIADKRDPGTASSAAGTVVVFRGLRSLELDDAALAFVLAREMGHVIGGHHEANVTTTILVGVATQILFPVLNLPALFSSGAATSAAASAASASLATTAVASAASFAGSRALRASFRPQQVVEAEALAMELLADSGWDGRDVAEQMHAIPPPLAEEVAWTVELRESVQRIGLLMQGPSPYDPALPAPYRTPRSVADLPPPLISRPF